jgi:hypothetical protein
MKVDVYFIETQWEQAYPFIPVILFNLAILIVFVVGTWGMNDDEVCSYVEV